VSEWCCSSVDPSSLPGARDDERGSIADLLGRLERIEVPVRTAIYCGISAAVDTFRNAGIVFKEIDK
jgi:hypothetical protein